MQLTDPTKFGTPDQAIKETYACDPVLTENKLAISVVGVVSKRVRLKQRPRYDTKENRDIWPVL